MCEFSNANPQRWLLDGRCHPLSYSIPGKRPCSRRASIIFSHLIYPESCQVYSMKWIFWPHRIGWPKHDLLPTPQILVNQPHDHCGLSTLKVRNNVLCEVLLCSLTCKPLLYQKLKFNIVCLSLLIIRNADSTITLP